jgi:hypothetical protein
MQDLFLKSPSILFKLEEAQQRGDQYLSDGIISTYLCTCLLVVLPFCMPCLSKIEISNFYIKHTSPSLSFKR